MTIAIIGATGRVGSEIVRGVLARGDAVTALVRDPGKARRAFGEPGGLHIRATRLDDPRDLTEAFDAIRTVFIAMGSVGIEGALQGIAINAAAEHLDRPGRQRPHGLDRPSRRGRGRAARAHRPGALGRAPRPDRTDPHVVAGGSRVAFGRSRRARHFRVAAERQFLERLTGAGVPAGDG